MERKKSFDAVAMVRQIRDAHYEQTKHMKGEERLAFYCDQGRAAQEKFVELANRIGQGEG